MIQRKQSLYFLIVSILIVVLYFVPLGTIASDTADIPVYLKNLGVMQFLAYVIGFIGLVCIFLFKNRPLQIKIASLNLILSFALVAWLVVEYFFKTDIEAKGDIVISFSILIPLLIMFFIYLSIQAIRKDERIVQSMNRLR
jgi:Domain of unknown function (DUF4293)